MANKVIYQKVAVTDAGDIIPGAEYTVTNERTGTALTIYSSRAGASKSAPYFADDNGVVQFWIDPGALYRVEATGPSGTYTDRYVEAIMLTESAADTEAGRALKVADGGLLSDALTEQSLAARQPASMFRIDDRTNNERYGEQVSVLNMPYAGGRSVEFAAAISSTQAWVSLQRSTDVWSTLELYHTGNLNPLEFGGDSASDVIAVGARRTPTTIRFALPVSLIGPPSSITFTGTFFIFDTETTSVLASGLTPTLVSPSGNKIAMLEFTVPASTTTSPFWLQLDTPASKITVNP